jgi:hypothetical protein
MLTRRTTISLLGLPLMAQTAPVYVTLWFDTEDYVEPSSDDAAKRLADDLDRRGVRATFKIVGEKARVLEQRKRWDVIRSLARHDIGYHAENHSLQPTPSVYLRDLGWHEGAAEFRRREGQGVADIERIFGVTPSCYGQPGSSWGPQSYPALRRLGIPVYLDEGSHVRVNEAPFWFGGLLHVYGMGRFTMRASLQAGDPVEQAFQKFDEIRKELSARGGGLISIYYHPTEFVSTEFWDGVNFPKGETRPREQWKSQPLRTREDSERTYGVLMKFVDHIRKYDDVRFVTARDFLQLYQSPVPKPVNREVAARHMAERQTFLETPDAVHSAADLLQVLLGLEPRFVDGPAERISPGYSQQSVPRYLFEQAKRETVALLRAEHRIPSQVWLGAQSITPDAFAATLAADTGSDPVPLRKANPEMEKYIATDSTRAFNWAIHPPGFRAPGLHNLARLQAWTLKPARLR